MHNYLSVEHLSTSEGALSSLHHFGNTNVYGLIYDAYNYIELLSAWGCEVKTHNLLGWGGQLLAPKPIRSGDVFPEQYPSRFRQNPRMVQKNVWPNLMSILECLLIPFVPNQLEVFDKWAGFNPHSLRKTIRSQVIRENVHGPQQSFRVPNTKLLVVSLRARSCNTDSRDVLRRLPVLGFLAKRFYICHPTARDSRII